MDKAVVRELLEESRDDVKHADQKASLLLAALGVGYGVVIAAQVGGDWNPLDHLSDMARLFWFVGVALAGMSVVAAGLAVWPRYTATISPPGSISFWGDVCLYGDPLHLQEALSRGEVVLDEAAISKLWTLARLVRTKYRYVRLSMVLAGGAAILMGIVMPIIEALF